MDQRESALERVRDTLLASDQGVFDAYNYITQVAFKMRKYNFLAMMLTMKAGVPYNRYWAFGPLRTWYQ